MPEKPVIPVGDAIQRSRLPGWLKWLVGLFRGTKIHAGPVDILLNRMKRRENP